MIHHLYEQIDWQQPWYHYLSIPKQPVTNHKNISDWLNNQLINYQLSSRHLWKNFQGNDLQFVPQMMLPEHTAYETFIANTGQIPTRDNFHDLLNGLIWLNFPKTKTMLNYLHYQDIQQHGIQSVRSALRNALTLFDENGGIVVSNNQQLLEYLQNFQWQSALWQLRNDWLLTKQTTAFMAFGHALLEKLINPRKNICSHTLLIFVPNDWFSFSVVEQREKIDSFLTNVLSQFIHQLVKFQPLPVAGIPKFHLNNHLLDFYQDEQVFRPARAKISPIFVYKAQQDFYFHEKIML